MTLPATLSVATQMHALVTSLFPNYLKKKHISVIMTLDLGTPLPLLASWQKLLLGISIARS